MKTTVSVKGQITIPKAVRDSLGIRAGTVLEISAVEGRMIAKKKESQDPIARWRGKGSLPVGNSVDEYLKAVRG
jgi:antitoxin PrlF